jgi:hypothetical protein
MGKDFIYVIENGFDLEEVYNKLFSGVYGITEASEEKFFNRIPELKEVVNIEVGCDGTEEAIIRLANGVYVVINKTIKL